MTLNASRFCLPSADDIKARDYNLDIKNPNSPDAVVHDPDTLLADYAALQQRIGQTRDQLKAVLAAALGGKRVSVVLSEHLPLLSSAPDGIQKLRGLILELAVRGKLVPQDPNDEPASELLLKILQERARLEAEGSLKKSKVSEQEDAGSPISFVVAGWSSAPMGEVVEIVRGITFPSSEKSRTPEAGRIRCLRAANVQVKIEWDDILYIRSEFVSRDDQMLRPNDIVMSMAISRELVGKVALVESQLDEPATFGGFLGVLRPHLILPRFVMAFLRAPTVRSSLIDSASQTTNIANISLAKLRPLPFPIPLLAEQHRIVAKVDELMALCDRLEAEQADSTSTHARLVETLLGTLTQNTDAADLTANWQRLAEHFDSLFTTEASINALKQTVLQLGVQGLLTNLPNIPTVKLGDLLIDASYGTSQKCHAERAEGAYPVLRIPNVVHEMIDLRDLKFSVLEEKELQKTRLHEGDIVVVRTNGSAELVGRCAVVKGLEEVSAFASYMIRLRFDQAIVDPEFAQGALRNHRLQNRMIDFARTTAGQYNVSIGRLRELEMPLPSLAEQHHIVSKVDELMALCDRLKADLTIARQHQATVADTLIESALEAA